MRPSCRAHLPPPYSRESARWIYEGYSYDPKVVTEEWIDNVMDVFRPRRRAIALVLRKWLEEGAGARYFLPELAKQKRETLGWASRGSAAAPDTNRLGAK